MPVAPGTFGSLLGPPLVWGIQSLLPGESLSAYLLQAGLGMLFFLLGVPLCNIGSRVIGRKDPGSVVIDEIAAFFVVFACVPVSWETGILGFLLFRLFDITKPWPVRRLEQLPEGWGVMADDLMAGLYACFVLLFIVWGISPLFV